jgi:hypothetical protein
MSYYSRPHTVCFYRQLSVSGYGLGISIWPNVIPARVGIWALNVAALRIIGGIIHSVLL